MNDLEREHADEQNGESIYRAAGGDIDSGSAAATESLQSGIGTDADSSRPAEANKGACGAEAVNGENQRSDGANTETKRRKNNKVAEATISGAVPQEESITELLDNYMRHLGNIEECAASYIPYAKNAQITSINKMAFKCLELTEDIANGITEGKADKIYRLARGIHAKASFSHDQILAQSLLISAFSAFDAYLGRLLRYFYSRKKELLGAIDRTATLSDLVKFPDLKSAIDSLIDKDIDSILRDSYTDAFGKIAKRFGLNTVTAFEGWKRFVELSQRRNLITHCDGMVSQQYIDCCKQARVKLPESLKVGDRLDVTPEYLATGIDILIEVGLKLGYTLWRKVFPKECEGSDKHMTQQVLALLETDKLELAESLSLFGTQAPGEATEVNRRIKLINLAQCYKWRGNREAMSETLGREDWSASIRDYRLCVAVLREEFDDAAKLMREIGRTGEMVDVAGYQDWPIFREFRKTSQFSDAFKDVYGETFEARIASEVELPKLEGARPNNAHELTTMIDKVTGRLLIRTTHEERDRKAKEQTNVPLDNQGGLTDQSGAQPTQ